MRSLIGIAALIGCAAGASTRWHHAEGGSCEQGIDVVFLQDTTQTFLSDLPIVTSQIPTIYSQVEKLFAHSRFAVAEFKDKPFLPLGWPEYDYCYRLVEGLSESVVDLTNAYAELYASAGGDIPEAQYQAIINTVYDNKVGWRPFATEPIISPDKTSARIIVLVTDAQPHMAGDMAKYPNQVPQLGVNPGGIWQDRFDDFCATHDYPSFQQVKAALDDMKVAVIFLIKPYNNDASIKAAWKWFNEDLLGQPSWFLQDITDDSVDFAKVLVDVMHDLSTFACMTTTESPTTTTEDTTTTTSTTTTRTKTTTTTAPDSTTPEPTTTTTKPTTDETAEPMGTLDLLTRPPAPSTTPPPIDETKPPMGTNDILTRPSGTSTTTRPHPTTNSTNNATIDCPDKTEDPCEPELPIDPCGEPPCGQQIANQIIINVPEGQSDMKIILEKA